MSSSSREQYRSPGHHRGNQNARQRANNEARAAMMRRQNNARANLLLANQERPLLLENQARPLLLEDKERPLLLENIRRFPGEHRGNQNARQRANNEARAAAVGTRENLRVRGGKRKTRKSHRKTRKGTRRH